MQLDLKKKKWWGKNRSEKQNGLVKRQEREREGLLGMRGNEI